MSCMYHNVTLHIQDCDIWDDGDHGADGFYFTDNYAGMHGHINIINECDETFVIEKLDCTGIFGCAGMYHVVLSNPAERRTSILCIDYL